MIAMLLIKLIGGTLAGIGGYVGKKLLGPKLVSAYKNAKTTLRGKNKGGSRSES
ncbi:MULTISPECIES: hypothetical protein [Bacillus cereus group]|uniref:hypothetical protein n=1 Tax=Bacillus cereus group TaxID=86661 RepID=UPI0018CF9287|nr:hypothetical protein [Bacillus thuringiensis]MBG9520305.1 hypothetical protein [Bacillus thuringiensis]MBG9520718.1 hypothetical protein [Bacillus thuringiensis]MBG9522310.1 hypothetical protein [Bacillus thuringiensis]